MALIACPDCHTEVSDRAPACPKCGGPIANLADTVAVGTALTTTQATSKRLKAQQMFAIALLVIGALMAFTGDRTNGSTTPAIGSVAMLGGLIWYLVTRFRIWWHHK